MSKRYVFLTFIILGLAVMVIWKVAAPLSAPQSHVSVNSNLSNLVETGEPINPIPENISLDANKVALGNFLFHDPRLSKDNSIACATWHWQKASSCGLLRKV